MKNNEYDEYDELWLMNMMNDDRWWMNDDEWMMMNDGWWMMKMMNDE